MTAKVALVTLLVNIIAPWLTYAALPDFASTLAQPNVLAVAQVNKIVLPRVIVAGDLLELTISWTTISQIFDTDSLTTANFLNFKIDSLPEVTSSYDDSIKTFTITSANPWISFNIWNLQITRTSIAPTTPTPNVVAVAQVWEVSIPQNLASWDTLNFTLDWISIVENFAIDKDTTLVAFADKITNLTSASGSYDSANNKVVMTAKIAWSSFSMSNLIISSNWININNIIPNIVPIAQVEQITIPRILYSDETISVTIDWTWVSQPYNISSTQTLTDFNDKINNLDSVNSSIVGWIITITAANAWIPFTISDINISNWTINWINIVPNQIAIAQEDMINIPRDLYIWDTVNLNVWWASISQWFTASSDFTISQLINQINALPNVYVSAYAPVLRTLTIKSKIAWTAFANPILNLTSNITSNNITINIVAQKQIWEYILNRNLTSWDTVSAIINWSPLSVSFSWTSADTINSFIWEINNSMSGVIIASSTWALWIHLEAITSWVWFTAQPLAINNSLIPTVLVANITPVKQKETIMIPNDIISWDTISLNLSWSTINTTVTQTFDTSEGNTLDLLKNQINSLADFSASVNGKDLIIESKIAWQSISVSNFKTTWTSFMSNNNTTNIPELKANVDLNINWIPSDWDNIVIGNCTIWFSTWVWDLNCGNNTANININWLDNESLASVISSIANITNTIPEGTRNITWTSSGNQIIFSTENSEISTQAINYINNLTTPANFNTNSINAWVIAQGQIDTISLPRNIVSWDSLKVVINWITVTQNFLSSSAISFNNLVTQINNLPDISATASGSSDIIVTADTAWTWFNITSIQFENNTNSTTSISNVEAVAQKWEFSFPTSFVNWDIIKVKIDGTEVTQNFATDSNTTINNLISSITSSTNVSATLTWTLWIILEAKNAWVPFVIDSITVDNTTNPNSIANNIPWVAQVEQIIIPFIPVNNDEISININWTIVSETWSNDPVTKLSLLNTKIDNLISVNSSFDGNNTFTITAADAWIPFTAWLSALGATITSSWIQTNINSWAQVDTLTVNRNLIPWDILNLNIAWQSITENYTNDKATTLSLLNTQINNLSEVDSIFDWNETLTITAADAWIPFTSWVLNIYSVIPSINQVANVAAVAQVDNINLARTLIIWDSLSININWTNIWPVVFSGSNDSTLADFITTINNTQSWVVASNTSNTITLTAATAWVTFTSNSFLVENNSLGSTTTNNVTAVKQVSEFEIPLFVVWDNISFTINGSWITQDFDTDNTTTINSIINKINALWSVNWSYQSNSWIISIESNTAWISFTLSQISIINTTPDIEFIANVSPMAQIVNMYPSWILREWLTYRVTINWTDYDYLTSPSDSISNIINSLNTIVTNTWILVSSGSDIWWEYLEITSSIPWIAFTYNSQVLDITAPIITMPISTSQTLKTWDTSTSNVSINEDGKIYLVLSWTTINNVLDLTSAVANNIAFVWKDNALSYSQYTVTIPSWIQDWVYNFVAVDDYTNVSQTIPGWLTIDNQAPIINIANQTITTNSSEIVISGNTEANLPVTISWWSGIINTFSDWAWVFSGTIMLNENIENNIVINVTDLAWNIWSGSVTIIHDNLIPTPFTINIASPITNSLNSNISITTESSILVSIYESWNLIQTGTTNWSWEINFNLSLTADIVNDFNVVATDAWWNENSSLISIIQDSLNPSIIINPLPNSVHTWSINISGTTEPLSNITLNNSGTLVYWTSDSSWIFDINIGLFANIWTQTINNIDITAIDQAWNTWTWVVSIIEDSIANNLMIFTPTQYTNQSTLTISGSTRSNATITISGWLNLVTINADNNGLFSWNVDLNTNSLNSLIVTSTDNFGNTVTWNIDITQDSINPTVTIDMPTHPTNSLLINIFWTTEANSIISIDWWAQNTMWISDWSWVYNIPVILNTWSINNIVVTSTDQAWNIWTGAIDITHDPIVVFINHNSPAISYTNNSTFSFSGTTKPNSRVTVNGWSWTLTITADWSWVFNWTVDLNLNVSNIINLVATDNTTNTANVSFEVIHDDITPILQFDILWSITNQNNLVVTWLADIWALVSINNGWLDYSNTASSSGIFSIMLPLNQNALNTINWTATDLAWNTSSSTWFTITHDNTAPVISWLSVSSTIIGSSMNINYIFQTSENSSSTFYIGSNSNVLSSLIMSWTTTWTDHSRVIPWFTPNTTYYYFVQSIDSAGNSSQSTISTVNFIDNTWPTIVSKNVNNITITWVTIGFSYSDVHFNSGTLARWTIDVTDWINIQTVIPNLTYSNSINNWSVSFDNLTSNTDYNYTINLIDDFWNTSSATWSFTTATNLILSWSNMTETWSVYINSWSWWTLDMSWTTLALMSENWSWLWSGSITIPGIVDIIYWSGWNFIISAPSLIDNWSPLAANNNELSSLISQLNTSSMTYTPSIIQTISAWWNVWLTASWWNFSISVALNSSQIWQTLRIYRSQDWINWTSNVPDDQCIVTSANTCTFNSNHFTYFTFVKPIWTAVAIATHTSWWGGSSFSRDYCPSWDNSPSYYDWSCGTTNVNTTNSWTTTTNTITDDIANVTITDKNIIQLANKYILKIKSDNYSITTTVEQKIDLWKKLLTKIDTEIAKWDLGANKSELLNIIKTKVKSNLDKLITISEEDKKTVSETPSETKYIPSTETKTDSSWNIAIFKFIDVENSIVVRNAPSYRWEIMNYLPRNFKVEVLEYGVLWSKIRYNWWTISYIRTKFLRDENREDKGRRISAMAFYDVTLQADIDLRQIKVEHSVNVRRWPSVDDAVKTTLQNGNKVIILDSTKVSWWYEIRWDWWHGWINSSYVEKIEK